LEYQFSIDFVPRDCSQFIHRP